jgi:hypothetical protein
MDLAFPFRSNGDAITPPVSFFLTLLPPPATRDARETFVTSWELQFTISLSFHSLLFKHA